MKTKLVIRKQKQWLMTNGKTTMLFSPHRFQITHHLFFYQEALQWKKEKKTLKNDVLFIAMKHGLAWKHDHIVVFQSSWACSSNIRVETPWSIQQKWKSQLETFLLGINISRTLFPEQSYQKIIGIKITQKCYFPEISRPSLLWSPWTS